VLAAVVLVVTASSVAVTALRDGARPPAPVASGDPIPVGEWKSTLHVGWLPDGLAPPLITSTAYAEDILYPGTNTPSRRDYLRVSLYPASETPDRSGQPVDVNGRQGYEKSEPTRTIVVFPLPSGRWANVEFGRGVPGGGPNGQPGHRETALRIARSIDQSGNTMLRTGFAPSYLPAGQRIVGVSTDVRAPAGFGRVHTSAPAGQPAPPPSDSAAFSGGIDGQPGPGVSIFIDEVATVALAGAERIADIQGSPAYRVNGGQMIIVTDFHGGALSVMATLGEIEPGEGAPPLVSEAELIKIAEGVRWLG
jgi:hypothetical protein